MEQKGGISPVENKRGYFGGQKPFFHSPGGFQNVLTKEKFFGGGEKGENAGFVALLMCAPV